MRKNQLLTGLVVIGLCGTAPALAQSATEGPLAAPTDPAAAPATKPTKPKHHKPIKTAHHPTAKSGEPDYSAAGLPPIAQPVAPRSTSSSSPTSSSNPVDFGMKWNGSNDSARETRVQNYDGSAQGTGAEVGMKLHF